DDLAQYLVQLEHARHRAAGVVQRDDLAHASRQATLVLLQRRGHLAERRREIADLVALLDEDLLIEVAAGDRDGAPVEVLDRPGDATRQESGEAAGEDERTRRAQGERAGGGAACLAQIIPIEGDREDADDLAAEAHDRGVADRVLP